MENKNKKIIWGLLFAILLAAFFVRSANISQTPAGLYPDEAINGTDALTANATGDYKLFYESNNGREGLFINLQALSIKLLGNTIFGLKIWSIIFGTLTVLGVFLLVGELFQNKFLGLIGAYLTAFSYWAINFSRIGFRAVMLPFILSFAFYFLFKAVRTKKYTDFIIAGIIYGLGLHTYIAFRVSPLVLILLLVGFVLTRKKFLLEYWKHILVFMMAVFIAAAPMLLDFFYFHPEHYVSRTSEISILNPEVNQGHFFSALGRTFGLSLVKYNFWGDQNWRQNYPPYPILNPLTGAAFLIGIVFIISKFFHLLWLRIKKGIRDDKLHIYLFLLAWFFTLLIPEFLAEQANPHALRSIGTLPAVMIISVVPFVWLFKKMSSEKNLRSIIISYMIAALVFVGLFDIIKYHFFFANNPKQHEAFEANLTEEAKYIIRLPANTSKFVIAEGMKRAPIEFLAAKIPNISYLYKVEIDQIIKPASAPMEILMDEKDEGVIATLESRFPSLKLKTVTNQFGDTFYVLR